MCAFQTAGHATRVQNFTVALYGMACCVEYFECAGKIASNLHKMSDSFSTHHNFVKALRYSIFQCDKFLFSVGLADSLQPLIVEDERDSNQTFAALLESELYYKIAHCVAHCVRTLPGVTEEIGAAICRMQFPASARSFLTNLDTCVKFFNKNFV